MLTCISQSTTTKFVLYLRISTAKSGGVDSNGIAAQQRDLNLYLSTQKDAEVIGTFTDVMSGAKSERPELTKALELKSVPGLYQRLSYGFQILWLLIYSLFVVA